MSAERRLTFDIDQLDADTENGMSKFIATCFLIKEITIYSSLIKLNRVEKLLKSIKDGKDVIDLQNDFLQKINKFKKDSAGISSTQHARTS